MIKLTKNHYVIEVLKQMLPFGIERMKFGAVIATLQYPEDNVKVYTLTLQHKRPYPEYSNLVFFSGLAFNILRNNNTTTIIQSEYDCFGNVQYKQQAILDNAELPELPF